jgi:hypothetical protein
MEEEEEWMKELEEEGIWRKSGGQLGIHLGVGLLNYVGSTNRVHKFMLKSLFPHQLYPPPLFPRVRTFSFPPNVFAFRFMIAVSWPGNAV